MCGLHSCKGTISIGRSRPPTAKLRLGIHRVVHNIIKIYIKKKKKPCYMCIYINQRYMHSYRFMDRTILLIIIWYLFRWDMQRCNELRCFEAIYRVACTPTRNLFTYFIFILLLFFYFLYILTCFLFIRLRICICIAGNLLNWYSSPENVRPRAGSRI